MFDENYENLAGAIIIRAVKDFRQAYRRIRTHTDDRTAEAAVREITGFFHSGYFCLLTDLDGPALLQRVIKEMDEKRRIT